MTAIKEQIVSYLSNKTFLTMTLWAFVKSWSISIYIYLAKYSKKKHNENLSSGIIFLPTLENIIILVTHVKNFEVVL